MEGLAQHAWCHPLPCRHNYLKSVVDWSWWIKSVDLNFSGLHIFYLNWVVLWLCLHLTCTFMWSDAGNKFQAGVARKVETTWGLGWPHSFPQGAIRAGIPKGNRPLMLPLPSSSSVVSLIASPWVSCSLKSDLLWFLFGSIPLLVSSLCCYHKIHLIKAIRKLACSGVIVLCWCWCVM